MPPSESGWRRHRSGAHTEGPYAFRRNLGQASSASRNRQNASPRSTTTGLQTSPPTVPRTGVGPQLQATTSEPIQRDEIALDEDLCQVVMAVDIKERGTVGCCYYIAEEERLYILEDVEQGGMDVIEIRMQSVSSR